MFMTNGYVMQNIRDDATDARMARLRAAPL